MFYSNEPLVAMAFIFAIVAIIMLAVVLQRLGEIGRAIGELNRRLPKDLPAKAPRANQETPPAPTPPVAPPTPRPASPPPPFNAPASPPPPRAPIKPSPPPPRFPEPAPVFPLAGHLTEARLGQRGLLIVGIMILVVGIGYFLQYSFQQGWVSPIMRVLMTYMAGGAILGLGEVFRRRGYAAYGLTLAGGGVATLYFATFAGYGLYGLLPALPAFALMIVVTMLAGTLAVFYDNRWLAVLGIIGGFATPLLIQVDDPATLPFFLYLVILNLGILGIAFYRGWGLLHYLGAVATWLVFFSWLIGPSSRADFWYEFVFANFTFLIYAFAPLLHNLRTGGKKPAGTWALIVPNTFIALGVSLEMISTRFSTQAGGILTVAYGLVFVGLAAWIQRNRPSAATAFSAAIVKAILFTGLTIPLIFSGSWITVFWALVAIALGWASLRVINRWVFVSSFLMGAIALLHLYFWAYPEVFHFYGFARGFQDGWADQALLRLFAGALTFGMLLALRETAKRTPIPHPTLATFTAAVAAVHLFCVLNVEVRGFFLSYAAGAADAATSILWGLFSMALIGLGFRKRIREVRFTGVALFAITLAKVVAIDMAQAATPFRILSSIMLGLLMIVASFLYHRFKHIVEPAEEKKPSAPGPTPTP